MKSRKNAFDLFLNKNKSFKDITPKVKPSIFSDKSIYKIGNKKTLLSNDEALKSVEAGERVFKRRFQRKTSKSKAKLGGKAKMGLNINVKKGALRNYLLRKKLIDKTERIPVSLLRAIKNAPDHSIATIERGKIRADVKVSPTLKRRVTFALNFRKKRR